MLIIGPWGSGAPPPRERRALEQRAPEYDSDLQMFREPARTLSYPVLRFWRWRVETGQLQGDGPVHARLADRVVRLGG